MLAQNGLQLHNISGKSHVIEYIQYFFRLLLLELDAFVGNLPCLLNIIFWYIHPEKLIFQK